jgi:nucleoside-diphosphate-sugar epimerase
LTEPLAPVSSTDLDEILRHTSSDVWAALRGRSIFLTGGTGFVGKWLLESLIHADRELALRLNVTVLTRNQEAFRCASAHLATARCITLLEGEIDTFQFPSTRFSHVVHAALPVAPPQAADASVQGVAVAGAQRVCALARSAGAGRLLHVSSGAVYGPKDGGMPLAESDSWSGGAAVNDYTKAKRLAEGVVSSDWPFEWTIARCFAFIGPYLLPGSGSAAADFIDRAAHGREIVVNGTGAPVRTYQYAGDMARWLLTCLVKGNAGHAYNVGSDTPTSIAELAEAVAGMAPAGVEVRLLGGAVPGLAGNRYIADTSRARAELGLANHVGLHEAIGRTFAWHATQSTSSRQL